MSGPWRSPRRRGGERGGGDRDDVGARGYDGRAGARRVAPRFLALAARRRAHLRAHRGTPGTVVVHVVRLDPCRRRPSTSAPGPDDGRFHGRASRPGARRVDRDDGDLGLLRVPDPPVPDGRDPDGPGRAERDELRGRRRLDRGVRRAAASGRGRALETGNVGFPVSGWNSHRPAEDGSAAFTRYGGGIHRPPDSGCAARLDADGPLGWAALEAGVSRRYTVDVVRCVSPPRRWDLGGSSSRRGAGGKGPTRSRRCNPAIASASRGRSGGRECST